MLRKIALGLILVVLAIQCIRPAKNLAAGPMPHDLAALHPIPPTVQHTLTQACYDCHSNTTRYPWYTEVQPVAWFIDRHVREGKRALNFSEFGQYSAKRAAHKLEEVADEVREGAMPLRSYTWLHPEARLTPEQTQALIAWADSLRAQLAPK